MSTTRERDLAAAAAWGHPRRNGLATAFADGCAHRDQQVIAYLRKLAGPTAGAHSWLHHAADAIERGDHVPAEAEAGR